MTVHTTVSPELKTPASAVPVPTVAPPMLHTTVLWSASPSASANPAPAQVRVSATLGALGLMLALVRVGALLEMVTVLLVTVAPASVPSDGVRKQVTCWCLDHQVLESVLVVGEMDAPSTVQAVDKVTLSPSTSEVVPAAHARVSPSKAGSGDKVADATAGAVLPTTTDDDTAAPVLCPS